ncbi:MAG: DUF3160 domain-containing protein [Spirochaetales bacterium]|nr:DUF3160 domain-containing protein [Spirochaetales bacterium]
MKKAIIVSCAVLLLFALQGCGRKATPAAGPDTERQFSLDGGTADEPDQAIGEAPAALGEPAERVTIPDADFVFDPNVKPLGAAHRRYLSDTIEFRSVPVQKTTSGKTAVVGSRVARFYPGAKLNSTKDLAKLPKGEPLPLGAFLSNVTEIANSEESGMGDVFKFEDNYNYFYEATYRGRKGLVFGADLTGLGAAALANSLTSFYYTKPKKSSSFYDYNGRKPIGKNARINLAKNRVAFEAASKKDYHLSTYSPDDMVALYQKESYERERCLFFTTDIFAHTLHLLFDRMLAASEEDKFTPLLKKIAKGFLAEVEKLQKQDKKDAPGFTRTLELTRVYFQVPQALLELAPVRGRERSKYGEENVVYNDVDRNAVLESYPEEVRREIELIDNAAGFALSPNFQYKEDYSQYKPRGHYTKNGVLSAYFRAMMWFGRIHLYMNLAQEPVFNKDFSTASTDPAERKNALDASLLLTPVAVVINKIAKEKPELLAEWRACYDPITQLIGMSDDLSLYDVMPALDEYPFGDLSSWSDDPKAIVDFLAWDMKRFPQPRIPGNSTLIAPAVGNVMPASGFRLFGQRFTYDSYIHTLVSPSRLAGREDVRGLDIMKAFGSRAADEFLAESDYPKTPGLKEALDGIEKEFSSADAAFWGKTYYNRTLYLVKSQAQFEQGQGFFFTETPVWNAKALLSSHGAWAELRHDTILYAKQSYAERGGDGDLTYRTIPVPRPIHYVEPNRFFFQNASLLVKELIKVMQGNSAFVAGYPKKLERYATILKNILPIVELEIADRPITDEQNEYLVTVPRELADLVLPVEIDPMGYADDTEQFRMALVADVYTNAQSGQVLETAVGIPYRLYVALNDGQGGKRIATGYTFSYYEFMHPMSDRMTDEQWKANVYADNPDLSRYLPFWAKGILTAP